MNTNNEEKIRNIEKFKKMREEMKGLKLIKRSLPFIGPVLGIFGVNTGEFKKVFEDFDKLEDEFLKLSEFPDKFNEMFSVRGWIAYEMMNPDIAMEALKIAETDVDIAEQFLVDYYTPENVEILLGMMRGVVAFRPRMDLAGKALIDYREERYHASVPVVLALMDGLVNDLNKTQGLGISADDADLTAWDSMTAHEKGLGALKEVMFKTRKITRSEHISVPYRHGILHGMDLGYANKVVAAKTWAALFAVRDWAVKVERGEQSEPAREPKPTMREILQDLKEHQQWSELFKESLENWKPRSLNVGVNIPGTGDIEDFPENTPERELVEFLTYWKRKNYGYMANCIWSGLSYETNKAAGKVREHYGTSNLVNFELLEIVDENSAVTEIKVLLEVEAKGNVSQNTVLFRLMVNESPEGNLVIRDMPDATWGLVNWGHGI